MVVPNAITASTAKFEAAKGLPEAVLLRTIMKNNRSIKEAVWATLREQLHSLDISLSNDAWKNLVVANISELEDSKLHVIE